MSKRHKKSKMTFAADGDDKPMKCEAWIDDLSAYEAPKGKKPKGRQKRGSHKRAYYDD